MSNQTRKLDLAVALVEAFSSAVYCALSKQTISTALLPGLRYRFPLENLWSMDEIPGNTNYYVLFVKNCMCGETVIRGSDKRSPLNVYICSFSYGTVSKEDTPSSFVYCWYKYLEPHDFGDALAIETVKLDSENVH